jgi:hypothetical protein
MQATGKILLSTVGVAAIGACSSDGEATSSSGNGPNRPLLAMIVFGVIAFVLIMVFVTVVGRRFMQRRAQWQAELAEVDGLGSRATALVGPETIDVRDAGTTDERDAALDRAMNNAGAVEADARDLADSMGETEISDRLEALASNVASFRRALRSFAESRSDEPDGVGTPDRAIDELTATQTRAEEAIERLAEERTRLRRPKPTFDDQF